MKIRSGFVSNSSSSSFVLAGVRLNKKDLTEQELKDIEDNDYELYTEYDIQVFDNKNSTVSEDTMLIGVTKEIDVEDETLDISISSEQIEAVAMKVISRMRIPDHKCHMGVFVATDCQC